MNSLGAAFQSEENPVHTLSFLKKISFRNKFVWRYKAEQSITFKKSIYPVCPARWEASMQPFQSSGTPFPSLHLSKGTVNIF